MVEHPGDRGQQHRRQRLGRRCCPKRVPTIAPARKVDVPARALFASRRLREEAGAQAHRQRKVFDRHFQQRRVIGRPQSGASRQVQLEQPGCGFGVHGGELDTESIKRRDERGHKGLETPKLREAVAEPARQRTRFRIPQSHLILQRGQRLVTQVGQGDEHSPQHLARGELAGTAIAPTRRGQADSPARPPGQLVQRARVRSNQQISGAGPNAEAFVVGDRRVGRIQRQQEIRHHGAVPQDRLEGLGSKCLSPDRPIHVRQTDEDELAPGRTDLAR